MGPETHEPGALGMSSDALGSSESAVVFLKVDRRRVEKSLKSTVLERVDRRMLGWRVRVALLPLMKVEPGANHELLRAWDSSGGSTGSTELLASGDSEGAANAAEMA